jgi:hypothetical protein
MLKFLDGEFVFPDNVDSTRVNAEAAGRSTLNRTRQESIRRPIPACRRKRLFGLPSYIP